MKMQAHQRLQSRRDVGAQGAPSAVRPGAAQLFTRRTQARAVSGAYDYIIVGGGTAGCVLANRLSADESKRVLVLEAGPSGDSLEIAVPAAITRLFKHKTFDWGLNSNQQNQLGREVYLARGKVLGGSSCTNATLYHRGSPADYDAWGLEGWQAKDIVDWFIAAENYSDGPAPYHGTGGVMNTELPRYQTLLHDEFFRACEAAGIPRNPDFNDWSHPQTGYGEFQVTQRNGERADMYRMYLKPAIQRGNLQVLTSTRTTKVQFEHGSSASSSTPRAVGVEFSTASGSAAGRHSAQLTPGGQVLLCAGAVHTPHLLQLSGVGPAAHLRDHGLQVVAALEGVGANLQDHPATLIAARTDDKFDQMSVTSQIYDSKSNLRIPGVLQYLFQRRGPLTTTGCDHGAFLSTTGDGEPDLQIRFVPGCALDADAIQAYIKFGELKKLGLSWPCGITMQLLAVRPKSSGSVSLKSTDPFALPSVDLGYFSDAGGQDLRTLRQGVRIARRIAEATPLAQYITHEQFPGPATSSDADVDEYVRRTACSGNALVGTCRMGPVSDPHAVVSHTDLSVHGVQGLRVIDASVIPRIPGGQTGAPTVMIAERAAAMLAAQQPRLGSRARSSSRVAGTGRGSLSSSSEQQLAPV